MEKKGVVMRQGGKEARLQMAVFTIDKDEVQTSVKGPVSHAKSTPPI